MSETNIAIEPTPLDRLAGVGVSAFAPQPAEVETRASLGRALSVTHSPAPAHPPVPGVELEVRGDLDETAAEWCAFETAAECTAFQSFGWLSKWQRHIGAARGVQPAIVLVRGVDGRLLLILPLAVEKRGLVRRLRWLGSELCDYNGPLVSAEGRALLAPDRFPRLWGDVVRLLRGDRRFRFDLVDLQKMPERIGEHAHPFLALDLFAHASGAYLADLGSDWETFYAAKRSSATRRRERRQLKHLAEHGDVRFVDVEGTEDVRRTIETLFIQKGQSFARKGVEDLFARPGYRDFYLDIATDPQTRALAHVSRLDVGSTTLAANLGLRLNSRYYLVLSSYQEGKLSRFGPGRAHLHELLRCTIERGFRQFDFTIGDEPYKHDWCDHEIRLYDHLSAVTLRGWPAVAGTTAFRRAKRLVKQNPALWHAFNKARTFAASIVSR
jgi:CelD/BcsL family acetyltransferase involved in cellulose biosynthesis